MAPRWFDIPTGDWIALNAKLRGALRTTGSHGVQSISATGTLSLTETPAVVLVDTSGGNVTLTLPPAASVSGYRVEVKKLTAANTVTLDANGSETIDGIATLAWTTQYQSFAIISDGSNWHVV